MKKETTEIKKISAKKRTKPRIIIVPHYIGTETAADVMCEIITDEIKKKIDKSA